jgi:hypothetical protein
MNDDSEQLTVAPDPADTRPILIVPYMWIGDFVRGHTVVRVLKQRWPNRPVDLLVTTLCAPLVDYMPGVRTGPAITARPSYCPAPGNPRSPRHWPPFRNGWVLSAKPDSD